MVTDDGAMVAKQEGGAEEGLEREGGMVAAEDVGGPYHTH